MNNNYFGPTYYTIMIYQNNKFFYQKGIKHYSSIFKPGIRT